MDSTRIGIAGTPELKSFKPIARKVLEALKGQDYVVESHTARGLGVKGIPLSEMKVDVMVTVGGDGTILRTLQSTDKPILGINAGILGFLTEVQPKDIKPAIKRLLNGDYNIDERLKLKTTMDGERLEDATNEAVLHTAHIAKMRHFEITIDGKRATAIRADGLIIATPTGSTSYAMSVGSSIIDPRVDALVIAPIAPFRLAARPLVVPARSKIGVTIKDPRDCIMVIDGQVEFATKGSEMYLFTGSERKARFISFKDDFYSTLEEKLIASAPISAQRN